MCDKEGIWRENKEEADGIILDYFKEIYSTSFPEEFSSSLRLIDRRVSDDMNNVLLKEFRVEEVRRALKQMQDRKSVV